MVGKNLSHYKILEELGRGGMGIVYKAEDTKLDRTVAIKVLPSAALASEDDRARFYREAKAAAQLHHPHIASVFEIDEAVPSDAPHGTEPSPFISMEYIEGDTLRVRIDEGPLKLEEAVRIGSEIGSALEAAHEKNIVHRDIKSANVMVTSKGAVKVLDFGLAKTAQSTMLTQMGSTLGTVTYMSPEQTRGEDVDLRSDIWSLGVVLFEMVTGKHPFGGDYEQAIVYSILNEPPAPLTSLRTGVPMTLEWIVNKCLAKDPSERYQSCRDILVDLKSVLKETSKDSSTIQHPSIASSSFIAAAADPAPPSFQKKPSWIVPAGVISALLIGGLIGFLVQPDPVIPAVPIQRLSLNYPGVSAMLRPAVSPDGSMLAYTSVDATSGGGFLNLHIQDLATGEDVTVEIEDGGLRYGPSFSPDGEWIAFFNGGDEEIYKIRLEGGVPTSMVRDSDTWRVDWTDSNDLYYTNNGVLFLSPASGTGDIPLLTPDSTSGVHMYFDPVVIDNETLVLNRVSGGSSIVWFDRSTNETGLVLNNASVFDVLEAGFILYYRNSGPYVSPESFTANNGTLTVQRFDIKTRQVKGSPLTLDGVGEFTAVSDQGSLYYASTSSGASSGFALSWLHEDGSRTSLDIDPGGFDDIAISPDGSSVALEVSETNSAGRNIIVYDLNSGTSQRLTLSGDNFDPAWSPDGNLIAFGSIRDGDFGVYIKPANGSGAAVKMVGIRGSVLPVPDFTPDSREIAYVDQVEDDESDTRLYVVDLESGDIKTLDHAINPSAARVSPDGRYIAYVYRGSPQAIHVVSIDGDERYEVLGDGAHYPRWKRDGKGIYLRKGGSLYFQEVTTEPLFRKIGSEREIALLGGGFDHFPSPIDDRVLVSTMSNLGAGAGVTLNVIINWIEELNLLLPEE